MMVQTEQWATPPSYDGLTLTLSRSALVSALREHARLAQRNGSKISVCLLDVDYLGHVNETHGVETGDAVLASIADRLRDVLMQPAWERFEHVIGRYDGDAFIVLARPCGIAQAEMFAEALRFAITERAICGVQVTASLGVAQLRIGETVDRLLVRAERAMRFAKKRGGDRVEVSSTPPTRLHRAKVVGLYD
jgi:diguanylate cyclase (GGDEF)-like protein